MKSYSIQAIERQISEDFVSVYKTAANFSDTVLYNKCMKIICNSDDLRCIISANDAGIPPVKSLLSMLGDRGLLKEDISNLESPCMGSLMAFLFKQVFHYKNQKDNLSVNMFGVKTAALFYDVEEFSISEN